MAEAKAEQATAAMESLAAELRNEKLNGSLSRDWAWKARKETTAIRRAVQSLGCKVHFSEDGDCIVGIESCHTDTPQQTAFSPSEMRAGEFLQHDKKPNLSASVSLVSDTIPMNPVTRVCESLCPLRNGDGGCRWPDAGCAQFGSQFVGLKANFDAFDRLSIYDSYFQSE